MANEAKELTLSAGILLISTGCSMKNEVGVLLACLGVVVLLGRGQLKATRWSR